ncbi:MAG: ABC transporter substrate-binding protein [Alphaproteobacteria bacterium]|nr:ABC transporter substrate-binding protein [Alphaproteobacteria bacterium]
MDKVEFALNWVPGGDHAPMYWAKKMGHYAKAGIDLALEPGRGSAASAQRVGAGAAQIGLADMAVVLNARGKGAELVGVMNVYANSPQGLYWLKSSGITGVKDLAGKKIGNPAGDAARTIFPALAKANNLDPSSVVWVNIDANAKLAALKSKAIDVTTSFFNLHHVFKAELGADMGFLPWREAGLNPYGNSIVANGAFLKAKPDKVAAFVKVTQAAYHACSQNAEPCVQALVEANGALKFDNELQNWRLVEALMSDRTSQTVALGWHDDKRMAEDYALVDQFLKIEKAYDVKQAYTNQYLDRGLKMKAVAIN